jgi:hypothetical protein
MKTIREWAEICAKTHPHIGNRWLELLNEQGEGRGTTVMKETMHEALDIISDNFSWHATAEGRNYWSGIKRDMEENRNKYKRKMFAIS